MSKIKLTENQKFVIKTLNEYYPNLVMNDGWLTGGHGVKLDMRSVSSLKAKGILTYDGRLTELGKTIEL